MGRKRKSRLKWLPFWSFFFLLGAILGIAAMINLYAASGLLGGILGVSAIIQFFLPKHAIAIADYWLEMETPSHVGIIMLSSLAFLVVLDYFAKHYRIGIVIEKIPENSYGK